jgi:hypothetical protein
MIEQVGQGRMLAALEQTTEFLRRSSAVLVIASLPTFQARITQGSQVHGQARTRWADSAEDVPGDQRGPGKTDKVDQTHRQEGEAILALADAAMAGKPVPSDFDLRWQNDFIKAQRGTFVPFTLTVDASRFSKASALVYVRATRRNEAPPRPARDSRRPTRREQDEADSATYPVDAIFPVELERIAGQESRISRGFSVLPGEYDVFVVMRERMDPGGARVQPRVAVVRQPLSVPDFWSNELTTSSIIVADRMTVLPEPVPPDQIAERPYAIGRNEITPAARRTFRKSEELTVVFLVYNPMVTAERHFDVKVEYHFFRKTAATGSAVPVVAGAHPPEQPGETYFNHTDPQRFNPALMGLGFDPGSGEPVMAGQVVPLAGFQAGDYRLAVQVVDLLSGKSISRDVFFTVAP